MPKIIAVISTGKFAHSLKKILSQAFDGRVGYDAGSGRGIKS
jgi:hypothetical protein